MKGPEQFIARHSDLSDSTFQLKLFTSDGLIGKIQTVTVHRTDILVQNNACS